MTLYLAKLARLLARPLTTSEIATAAKFYSLGYAVTYTAEYIG